MTNDEIPPKARARGRQALVALDHADEADAVDQLRERYTDARDRLNEALEVLES